MAPTLIASYAVYSAGADTSTLTTPSFQPANGEVITVKCCTWSTGEAMTTPTGGGQTYTQSSLSDVGGFAGYATVFTTTVQGSPAAFAISSTALVASRHSMIVERWGNAQLAATPATPTPLHAGTSTFTASITTAAAGSVCSWCMCDENSVDPSTRVYQVDGTSPLGTEDGLYDGHVGANSVQYFAYTPVLAAAGAHTFGLSSPTGLNWAVAGVEIQAGGPPPPPPVPKPGGSMYGTKLNPTAGQSIVALGPLTAGRYRVVAATAVWGTVGATDANNMALVNGAGTVSVLMTSGTGRQMFANPSMLLDVASGGTLSVVAVGNSSAGGVNYGAQITATPDALYE